MNRPKFRFALSSALAIGVALMAVALLDRHERRLDWTADHRNTLTGTTRTLLASYPHEIRATVFLSAAADAAKRDRWRERLDSFQRASNRFQVRFVDPVGQPTVAAAYDVRLDGQIVLESDGRREVVHDATEARLAAALVRLARRGEVGVVFVTGHREHSIRDTSRDGYSRLAVSLRDAGIGVRERMLMRTAPDEMDDNTVLVLAGPRDDLATAELDAMRAHRERGGHLLVLVDPHDLPALEARLAEWGIAASGGVVVDPSTRLYGSDATVPVITEYARHPITNALTTGGTRPTFFPVARGLRATSDDERSRSVEVIASTGEQAWEESDDLRNGVSRPIPDPDERRGPIPMVMVAEDHASGSRLVVVGDSDFASNGNRDLSGNGVLMESCLEWLMASDSPLPVFAARAPRPLLLSEREFGWRVTAPAFALPVFFTIVGGVVVRRGRRG